MLPVGLNPPLSVAVSEIVPPMVTDARGLGDDGRSGRRDRRRSRRRHRRRRWRSCSLRRRCSWRSSDTFRRWPACRAVAGYEPLPLTVTVWCGNARPLQSAVAYRLKVIVPVGLTPPLSEAVSIDRVADDDRLVGGRRDGRAGLDDGVVLTRVAAGARDRGVVAVAAVRGDPVVRPDGVGREGHRPIRAVAVDRSGVAEEGLATAVGTSHRG